MSATLVVIDVGASRTRVRLGASPDAFDASGEPLVREVSSSTALLELLAEVRAGIEGGPVHLWGGVAAPSTGSDVRRMTNWREDGRISVPAIQALGYDEVHLLNDLEAAGHGLVALLEGGPGGEEIVSFDGRGVPEAGNRALVIPGSGLGSAGIVDLGPGRDPRWHVVPTEVGHAPASWEDRDQLLRQLTGHLHRAPTWEDVVSGPGLENLWRAAGGGPADDALPAPEIAALAEQGHRRAREALEHYYLFAARFAQVLALSFLSAGGLYLAGDSTRSNAPLIPEEPFLHAFQANPRMAGLLEGVPVFLVLAEINLRGPWRLGWRHLAGAATDARS